MDTVAQPLSVEVQGYTLEPQPLTDRILTYLPEPPRLWKALWALLPVLHAVALMPLYNLSGLNPYGWELLAVAVPFNLILSYAILHALWGSAKIMREAHALEPGLTRLTVNVVDPHPFRGMESARWPLMMTLALTLVLAVDSARISTWYLALSKVPFDFLIYLPLNTLIWTYLMLMTGLKRLGKEHLTLEAYCGDRGLGLRPVGRLASSGFWIFTVNLSPVLLLNISYGLGFFIGLAFFLVGMLAFFLSLLGLHQQMLKVKRQQLARAQSLYVQAYEHLGFTPSLETLQKQAHLLSAAEALERRADTIQTWPFTNAIFTRIIVLATSVITAIVTRFVMKSLGL